MQDRQPGKPGQYKATLTPAEFQKMQAGQQFIITMIRDDQPIVEGTPYSKAAVLPDVLAKQVCPNMTNPTPADAFRGLLQKTSPRNLLDNSDFRNPVNQRGLLDYTAYGNNEYFIDRWIKRGGNTTPLILGDGFIRITKTTADSTYNAVKQAIPSEKTRPAGKTFTAAVKIKNVEGTGELRITGGASAGSDAQVYGRATISKAGVVIATATIPENTEYAYFGYTVMAKEYSSLEIEWAALYEGEYGVETLPEYQAKGYAAELAECQRYYLPDGEYSWSIMHVASGYAFCSIKLPVTMRVIPSIIENPKKKFMVYNNGWTEIDLSLFTTLYLQPGEMTFMVSMSKITNLQLESGKSYLISGIPALSADL